MKARSVLAGVALAAFLAAAQGRADAPPAAAHTAPAASQQRDVSLEEYRGHLQALTAVVEACAKARDAATCDPALVGTDDRLPSAAPAPAGANASAGESARRLVSYGWLRALLTQVRNQDKAAAERAAKQAAKPAATATAKPAAKPDATPAPGAKGAPAEELARTQARATAQLLKDATARLDRDLAQIDAAPAAPPMHTQERATMTQVLADPSFRNLEEPAAQDSVLDKIARWLRHWIGRAIDRIVASISKVVSRSVWLGRLLLWGLILGVCVGLVWGLLQLERGWRTRLVPEGGLPGAGAASARDWQLWLEDARQAAAAGQWREAIHFLYWASISRLESRRLWPADRARTPREYLALVAPEDPRKAGLATLTGSFERIWYGGRAAGESDYRDAEQLAAALIAASGARGGAAR
ncbi:MAG: DUF4129 domain-containing protein [Terracidiphilus sp.]